MISKTGDPESGPAFRAGKLFDHPPRWAQLMRQLLAELPGTVETVMQKYTRPDGSLLWPTKPNHTGVDALDDAYESFHNWPLFHLVGGDTAVQRVAEREFDAITEQFKQYDTGHGFPMVVDDYEQGYDWFHQGEGYLFFYQLCAANPRNTRWRELAQKYAGFLQNIGTPEPNYDAALRILRCCHVGSMGPGFRNLRPRPCHYGGWMVFYGLPFQDFPDCEDPERYFASVENALRLGELLSKRQGTGDVAVNLASTSMAVNAYLLGGGEHFRAWALDYIDAWIERAERNGGLIPDNVGLSGRVGENIGGKWYGGHYGWTWPHGWRSVGDAVTIAAENALLLTGDQRYTGFLRTHIERLAELGIESEGTLHTPHKFGDPGWYGYKTYIPNILKDDRNHVLWKNGAFEFYPMTPYYPVKLCEMSGRSSDLELGRRLRNHFRKDWTRVDEVPRKDQSGHEAGWLAYVRGEFSDYPEKILEHNLGQMRSRMEKIATDSQDPATYTDSYLQLRNPFSMEGLVQLTMGCTLPVYNGGLLQSPIRHFDPERKRPGLADETAALVERIDGNEITLTLANLSRTSAKTMVVQSGSFAQHRFTRVADDTGSTRELDSNLLSVQVPPQSQTTLRLTMRMHCAKPTASLPWQ